MNFQILKLDLEKAEEPEIKLPTSVGSLKKQESSRKTSTSALLSTPKPLTVWITTNHLTCLLRNLYTGKKQQLKLYMEQQTGSKSGKEYVKAVYCSAQLFSCVRLCATPWTVVCQAPLSMGFSRQESWSGLPFPSPRLYIVTLFI